MDLQTLRQPGWQNETVFYQIYPLGFCGAPLENDGAAVNRIQKVKEWIPHLKKLGVGAVYFCPVFDSDRHGYDTRDFRKIDCRLGSNEEFQEVCGATRWQGTMMDTGLRPTAPPTAWAETRARLSAKRAAICP